MLKRSRVPLILLVAISVGFALAAGALLAQSAISADGVVESTSGGFKFPDGTVQATAATHGLAPVEDTGQQKCYDATGNTGDEIACAGTGQDGEKQAGVDWPAPRFTENMDGTVTDSLTGLIWLKDANCFGFRTWAEALADANGLMTGQCNLTDGSMATQWRLANVKELLSLVDYSQRNPALPTGHPFINVQSGSFSGDVNYWSSTSVTNEAGGAWIVEFHGGDTTGPSGAGKNFSNLVWPLRGGQ